jgi:hypothetical protein
MFVTFAVVLVEYNRWRFRDRKRIVKVKRRR